METKRYLFAPGMTTLCVLYLENSGTINQQICAHEAEGAILAYRGMESLVTNADSFFTDTLYMRVQFKTPGTVRVGDTIQVVADTFFSGGFGTGGPPAMQQSSGHILVAKPTNGQVWWGSTNSAVLQSLGAGQFRADSIGTAFVKAGPNTSPSTRTRWWYPFLQRGDSLALTVLPALPQPAFQVDSIGTTPMPIVEAGSHLFGARVVSAPSGTLMTRWVIVDSRTQATVADTTVTGTTLYHYVGPGSYTLTFTVTPSVGATTGFHAIQSIPVCATESEHLWGGGGGKQGGGSTNAIPGCEEYPQ